MIMADLVTSHVQKKNGAWVVTDQDGSQEILTHDQLREKRTKKEPELPPEAKQKPKLRVR